MEFIVGLIVGALVAHIYYSRQKASGTFVIDFSDPMKDVCRFEMDESLDSIYEKKRIVLDVRTYESQE